MAGETGHGHRRGNTQKDQNRRHQESAADPEQPRDEADTGPQRHQEGDVDRDLSYGKVDIQGQ